MKKQFNLLLMAALVCGLSFGLTSCKDDKDDGGKGDDPEELIPATETEEANAAYTWLINMTDAEEFGDDWASKTYEPTIGIESKNQANTRIVVVADLDQAKLNFASISGFSISELSISQSQTIEGVGTLTWTPSATGASNLATVDVSTKLIPHLTQIVYCTIDQVGDNGGYKGTAYYRFGDVIEDADGYFWVCVKPAFGTGKGAQQTSYWINILNRDPNNGKSSEGTVPPIPKENMETSYDKVYNDNTIILPTKLQSTKEMTHNLANLVWALLYPEKYHKTVGDDGIGIGGYEYKYNGEEFVRRVARMWKEKGIWEKLFNRTYDEMKQINKLNFYYNGYHFTPKIHLGSSNLGCAIVMGTQQYEKSYVTTTKQDEAKNLEMKEAGAGFDMRRYCSDPEQNPDCAKSGKAGYAPAKQFSSENGYWIVRMKTGKQIIGKLTQPSVYAYLTNTTELYRYNASYNIAAGDNTPVEDESTLNDSKNVSNAPDEGKGGTYMIGDVLQDQDKGGRWFCISGSPQHEMFPGVTDNEAWFISFDYDRSNNDFAYYQEEQMPEVALRFMEFIGYLSTLKNVGTTPTGTYCLDLDNGKLGRIGEHIKEYTGVDLRKMFSRVDSTWTFLDYTAYMPTPSKSTSYVFNVGYNYSPYSKDVPIARCIIDYTQAGDQRASQKKPFDEWHFRCYKHYETYDPSRITLTQAEEEVGMTKWQAAWPITDDQMRISDVTSQEKLNKYAKGDKWQKNPRTKVESNVYASDYIWENGAFKTDKTTLFKEPVLMFRVMKIKDKGGKKPYLYDTSGNYYKVVHLQNDATLYHSATQAMWAASYGPDSQENFFLDNKLYPLKKIDGLGY